MFTKGFEKTAAPGGSVVRSVTKAIAAPLYAAGRFLSKQRKKSLLNVRQGLLEAGSPNSARGNREVGSALTKTQLRSVEKQTGSGNPIQLKHAPETKGRYNLSEKEKSESLQAANRKRVIDRAERIHNGGPSFMSRHPLFTLGSGYLAGKMMSESNKQKEQPPQMIYPQY
ncbi:MAG: hypothetical protein EBU84_20320 [Actinobacteria bacterium]|nr:hypothetical protein [Actinomycetota bacterium]